MVSRASPLRGGEAALDTMARVQNLVVHAIQALPQASDASRARAMKIKVVVHEADEGGFWAEVPALPGCATQGETMDELLRNLRDAIEGCLSVDVTEPEPGGKERILEIAL